MQRNRVISMAGAPNFRDLGGYGAAGGRTVKWGLLYRSDDLSDIDASGVETIRNLGIRTVVDFRDRVEASYSPDNLPDTVERTVKISIDAGSLMRRFSDENLNRVKSMGMMITVYRALIHDFQPSFRRFFATVSAPDNLPLLFHCTAGKDRTGVGAALLLTALGVDRETVFADYLLSDELLRKKYVAGVDYDPALAPLYGVAAEFLEAAFEVVDNDYGGPERYLAECLGADAAALRELFTE